MGSGPQLAGADRVVSRAALIEHVWDGEADPFSNTVETHLYRVRRKLARAGKKDILRTVPEHGYTISGAQRGLAFSFSAPSEGIEPPS